MIVVTGHMTVDPAQRDDFLANAHGVISASRAEDGCIDYVMAADPVDEGRVVISEQWESSDAIDNHLLTPHFAEFGASLGGFTITAVEVNKHEVSATSKLM